MHQTNNTLNRNKLTVREFFTWPKDKRRAFVERWMQDAPGFIKAPLLA